MLVAEQTKTCPRCELEKEAESFYKNKSSKDGLSGYCKQCFSEKAKERNAIPENREANLTRCKARYHEKKDEYNEQSRDYYRDNAEYFKTYRYENGARQKREWYARNLDVARERSRLAQLARRWTENALAFFDSVLTHDPCVYCGRKTSEMTRDHITPIACGGNSGVENLAPACLECNSAKRERPLLLFLLRRLEMSANTTLMGGVG